MPIPASSALGCVVAGCLAASGICCGEDVYPLNALSEAQMAGRYRDLTDASAVAFLIFGDGGTGSDTQHRVGDAMLHVCAQYDCQFAIGLGDNIYEDGVEGVDDPQFQKKFEEPYRHFGRFDFWMILGNHDWRGNAQAQVDYTLRSERWRMPGPRYPIAGLPPWLRIYGIDTQSIGASESIARAQRSDLRGAWCGGDAWHILFGHHPAYSSGKHGDHRAVRDYLSDLMGDACGGDLFLSGHDHHQEHLDAGAYQQVVQGAAGKLRPLGERSARSRFAASRAGFGLIRATPRTLVLSFHADGGDELYAWQLHR